MTTFTFILLLKLAAISTIISELQTNFTDVTAVEVTQTIQLATLNQLSETPALNTTTATFDRNTPEETRSYTPLVHTTQSMPQTAPTLTSSSGTTTVKSKVWKSTTMVLTSQTSKQINNSTEPVMLSNIAQSHGTGRTPTSQIKLNEMTSSFISTFKVMAIFTETTSIKAQVKISTSTKPVPGDEGAHPSTSETPAVNYINKAKKKDSQHAKVVAAIIGGAMSLMIVGFLLIYIHKQRLQKQQTTMNWAGPSPFLEGTANNGNVVLRSSNHISFTSFLPHRLSRRFSLLPETNEMKEITLGATIEEKHKESTFGQAI
ncbi:hypothetical protein ATANTOWER_014317 [Ataeniobius toweri]|uniref:Mid2 domain-containing protein n=1 Tax=Ataeniobius toweri TaxID=208326 RepID=A0ABU7BGB6_9TELE|nr:hypothetical protein [Ataeniobius toweri]